MSAPAIFAGLVLLALGIVKGARDVDSLGAGIAILSGALLLTVAALEMAS